MKKLKYLLITFVMIIIGTGKVSANELKNLNIDVYIDENGTAEVTEVWDMYVDEGTEIYKSVYNMDVNNSSVFDFKVMDENKKYYTNVEWNINSSIENKKNKSGINYTDNGLELCWGMGSYGNHLYTISYKVSNFIINLEDAQIAYFRLVNNGYDIDNMSIDISSYFDFTSKIEPRGYGYDGYVGIKDGKIHMSAKNMKSRDYVVLLAKFDMNTFNASYNKKQTFNEILTTAKGENDNTFGLAIAGMYFIIIFLICIFSMLFRKREGTNSYDYNFGKTGKKISKKDVNHFRGIPCNKDVFRAFWVSEMYGIGKKRTDFLGAIFLKWLKEKQIKIEKKEVTKLFGRNELCSSIDLSRDYAGSSQIESVLYNMLREASSDNCLEKKELEKWCSVNSKKIIKWFHDVLKFEKDQLVLEGKIIVKEKKYFNIFKRKSLIVDSSMIDEAIQLMGLKKFFEDFTIINQRGSIEVTLFEEYLIYAQIFGIADKVAKEFKELYPQVMTNNNDFNYGNIMLINSISTSSTSRISTRSSRTGGGGAAGGGSSGSR